MAFAFQLLLTNFSWHFNFRRFINCDDESTKVWAIRKIETAVILDLCTVSISLFVACFLASKLSLVERVRFFGTIIAVVI